MSARLCLLRKELSAKEVVDILIAYSVDNYTQQCLDSKRSECFQAEFPDRYKLHYKVVLNANAEDTTATIEAFIETDEEKSEETADAV